MLKINQILNSIAEPLLQTAGPRRCTVCGDILSRKDESVCSIICGRCLAAMPLVTDFGPLTKRLYGYLSRDEIALDAAFSMIDLKEGEEFADAIYALKYRKYRLVGRELGKLLARHIQISGAELAADIIVPVPLHAARMRSRGFNQAEEIALGMKQVFDIPIISGGAVRTVNTNTQTALHGAERVRNVANIFTIDKNAEFSGADILIVDDVFTTRSTTNSLARCLKSAGAGRCTVAAAASA